MRAVLLLLLCLPLSAGAAMYRWVDAKGQVHYTQDPPPQGGQKVDSSLPPPSSSAPSPSSTAPAGHESSLKKYARQLDAENGIDDRARQIATQEHEWHLQNCKELRGRLKVDQAFRGNQFTYDESGGRHYRPVEQVDSEMTQLQAEISQNCQE